MWIPNPKRTPQAVQVFLKMNLEAKHPPGLASAWPQGFSLLQYASPVPGAQELKQVSLKENISKLWVLKGMGT